MLGITTTSLFRKLLQRWTETIELKKKSNYSLTLYMGTVQSLEFLKSVFSSLWKDFYNLLSPQYIVCKQLRLGFDLFYLSAATFGRPRANRIRTKHPWISVLTEKYLYLGKCSNESHPLMIALSSCLIS